MQSEPIRDVILVLQDGKEIRVSGNELSAASDFFFTLQNTDMKETREGVIRLEHINEDVMRDVLEFMRSGSVQITHENAQDLIKAADYLIIPGLKRAAGRFLRQIVQPSNCIPIYYFAERYQCEDLVVASREFILSNFAAVAETQEFLQLESQEVEKWICRDEIVVSSEDVVFTIILRWIKQGKSERRGKFLELFRHIRLSFVTRSFLQKCVVTNKFVKESTSCLKRVKDALKGIFPNSEDRQHSPRNWRDSHLVLFAGNRELLCYDLIRNKWYKLSQWSLVCQYFCDFSLPLHMMSCQRKLYVFSMSPLLKPLKAWGFEGVFQGGEMAPGMNVMVVVGQHIYTVTTFPYSQKSISKYNASSNSWVVVSSGEETASFDTGLCAVSMGDYIYVLGGLNKRHARRFDTIENKWEQIADMYQEIFNGCGVAAHGKIFVAGGPLSFNLSCQMYDVSFNQWHCMALSLNQSRLGVRSMVCFNGLLYTLTVDTAIPDGPFKATVESYDFKTNKWEERSKMSFFSHFAERDCLRLLRVWSLNISKDWLPKPNRDSGKGPLASLRSSLGHKLYLVTHLD